jgi:hypothetical protein
MFSRFRYFFVSIACLHISLSAQEPFCNAGDLITDLMIVDYWDRQQKDSFPVTYNNLMYGGYLNMPSARMGAEGEVAFGYSSVPPYRNYNIRCQPVDWLEVSGNYRIFSGVVDPVLGAYGFGEFSDKGLNLKFSFLHPEDSDYLFPGMAIGFDDVMGTRAFADQYFVVTQVVRSLNLEISLGIGAQRIRGLFGGILYMPFYDSCWSYLKQLAFVAEYDATAYKSTKYEPHPRGHDQTSHINYGIKYRLWDIFDFSVSTVRGKEIAWTASVQYNLGETPGFVPKIDDPLSYLEPCGEPIGFLKTEDILVEELLCAFRVQGFDILGIWLTTDDECGKLLRMRVLNNVYRLEPIVHERLNALLAILLPSEINTVIIAMEGDGVSVYEYHYYMEFVRDYYAQQISEYELNVITPMRDITCCPADYSHRLYFKDRGIYAFNLIPKTQILFGSSRGKFKYAYGLNAGVDGFFSDISYHLLLGWLPVSNIRHSSDIDMLNPSQLINVRTDVIRYYQQNGLTLDTFYLQKIWNLGYGWYTRCAGGYVDMEYGGIGSEVLYCPINSCWAFGVEVDVLLKRQYNSVGFTTSIRKLNGFTPTYQHFIGQQYFLDIYYNWKVANMDFEVNLGKFLANDVGAKFQVSRYFPSGLRFSFWYTLTNANDMINGKTYYDTGFAFSMPLDIFFSQSSRSRWGYGMSAWLRDCGFRCGVGDSLYRMIQDMRES